MAALHALLSVVHPPADNRLPQTKLRGPVSGPLDGHVSRRGANSGGAVEKPIRNLTDLFAHGGLPPSPNTVMLTFGTAAVVDFVLNWAQHVSRIPELEPFFVAALDLTVLAACEGARVRSFLAPHWEIIGNASFQREKQYKQATEYFRSDLSAFKKLGFVKILVAARFLEQGYSVLVSDADVVWLRHPWSALRAEGKLWDPDGERVLGADLGQADVLTATDVVDLTLDAESARLMEGELNTGILFMRSSAHTAAFASEWARRVLYTRDGHDQQEFNHLVKGCYPKEVEAGRPDDRDPADLNLRECERPPYLPVVVKASSEDRGVEGTTWVRCDENGTDSLGRHVGPARIAASTLAMRRAGKRAVLWMWHRRLRAAVLPIPYFIGGHPYFVQHAHEEPGAPRPIAVHMSWGFGDLFGKRERLRENGWWLVEDASYFTGRFLRIVDMDGEYAAAVAPFSHVAHACQKHDSDPARCWHPGKLSDERVTLGARDPRAAVDPAEPHLQAQARLRRVVKFGLALARASGRTLVLPPLMCYCERFWWLLKDCRVAGAERMPVPFQCPFDFLFEPYWWDRSGVDFRHTKFWDDARLADRLRSDASRLSWAVATPGRSRHPALARIPTEGAKVQDVAHAILRDDGLNARAVLEVDARSLATMASCAFLPPAEMDAFNRQLLTLLGGHSLEFCSRERNVFVGASPGTPRRCDVVDHTLAAPMPS